MIRIRLRALLEEKSFRERRRITLVEVAKETGLSRATLTRVANVPGYRMGTDVIEALCRYLNCAPGDLLELVDELPAQERLL